MISTTTSTITIEITFECDEATVTGKTFRMDPGTSGPPTVREAAGYLIKAAEMMENEPFPRQITHFRLADGSKVPVTKATEAA